MAEALRGVPGGIRGLRKLLDEHGEAVNFDLLSYGWRRADIGRHLSWADFRDFIHGLPPTGDSAVYRAQHPQSWWVTPEYVATKELQYVLELANWQRGGGKKSGPAPKPPKIPTDTPAHVKTPEQWAEKRREQKETLRRRRASQNRRTSVKRINPGQEVKDVGESS